MTDAPPFTQAEYLQRIERAAAQAAEAGLAGVLVTPGPDLAYFTGYAPGTVAERITLLVIESGRDPAMLVPAIERGGVEEAPAASAISFTDYGDGVDQYAIAAQLLNPRGRYAISDAAWAMHLLGLQRELPDAGYLAMTSALPMLRAVKDPDELERLAAAGAAVDECFDAIARRPFAGRRESEIAAELTEMLLEHGHSTVEFTLVGSGPNGANPHHEISERTIVDGDMIVLDFGGIRDGYASDTTRTVHVGEPTAEEHEVYEVVRAAQQAGFEAVGPGVACQDIDRAARRVIDDAGYGQRFIHRVGHGIGLTVHEPPYMVEGESTPIAPGMCFSIEPGIYFPDRFGVRIEDIVAATPEGGQRLNNATRDLQLVG